MKTIEQLLLQPSEYSGEFSDISDVMRNWATEDHNIKHVIYATYGYEDYSGSAYILYIGTDNKLYECMDCHCSCNGLEDWKPEEVTVETAGVGCSHYADTTHVKSLLS